MYTISVKFNVTITLCAPDVDYVTLVLLLLWSAMMGIASYSLMLVIRRLMSSGASQKGFGRFVRAALVDGLCMLFFA